MLDFSTSTRRRLIASGIATAAASLLLIGCGDDGLGQRYKVTGSVTYKGQPLAEGSISFYPSGGGPAELRGATGVVKDGYYSLSTQGDDDGAFPGDYEVTITSRKPDMSNAKAIGDKIGGLMPQEAVAKAYKKAPSAIPQKYESPQLGGLRAKVEPKSNTIDFALVD